MWTQMGGSDRTQSCKFFIKFLSVASPDEIRDYLQNIRKEAAEVEQSCIELCYHMKGVTFNEAWGMSPLQRNKIVSYINKVYKEQEEAYTGKKSL